MTAAQRTEPLAGIAQSEFEARRERLLEHVRSRKLSGYVLFEQAYIQYFTGFWFLSNERPVVFAQSANGDAAVFVPEFEVERTRAETSFERIESYPEYPGVEHPMLILARRPRRPRPHRDRIAADQDGYPGHPRLPRTAAQRGDGRDRHGRLADEIEQMIARKSAAEIELIRESGRWCAHAHRLLQEYTRRRRDGGGGEPPRRARDDARDARGARRSFGGQHGSSTAHKAGYRGQIGRRSSWAHAIAHNIEFQAGDLLVTETGAPVWGYNAELERGMVIGRADRQDATFLFDHTVAAQQVAFDAFRPGVTCADVDGAVMRYFERHDLLPYWRQHTGHAIGLRNHEAPFLDVGDHTPIEPGMVFTIEPGLYDDEARRLPPFGHGRRDR